MCGIFGIISNKRIKQSTVRFLAHHSEQRGKDSSGLLTLKNESYEVIRSDYELQKLVRSTRPYKSSVVIGHSRLITNGLEENQPVVRNGLILLHNGIIVNADDVWDNLKFQRTMEIDSEAILGVAMDHLASGRLLETVPESVFRKCRGTANCVLAIPRLGKLLLFSNSGSLYLAEGKDGYYFASEKYPLKKLRLKKIRQIHQKPEILSIPICNKIEIKEFRNRTQNLLPSLGKCINEEKMLEYLQPQLKRCSRCILPETMPFIEFDHQGVCNYCHNYRPRNRAKPRQELFKLVEPYRRKDGAECILPFSGGRDSCYGLHLVVKELKMRPITYTYDWGMVTDLGRRNISRMCAELGVENIIVAADIEKKRKNIKKNLQAWLKSPHLGMISILTAGDKHFFRHVETVKKQTRIKCNLWGVNPLEVTHFKAGFLGVGPDFAEKRVYIHGISKQLNYQCLRLRAMMQSLGYFNSSLWDTISGEYYRSFTEKKDYFHIFDYWRWDEKETDHVLKEYDWELAPDTKTTWRIGDGTAAFYNYIYYTVAGFTEHDTFRSNQIREGDLNRDDALQMVQDENRPRYPNIKWYLDAVNCDFSSTIKKINKIKKLF
jgi:predicted glutamine amidotransferase